MISEGRQENLFKLKTYKQIIINFIFWEWDVGLTHARQVLSPDNNSQRLIPTLGSVVSL